MKTIDWQKFIAGLHDYLAKALRPLHERITALEAERDKTLADAYAERGWRRKNTRVARW